MASEAEGGQGGEGGLGVRQAGGGWGRGALVGVVVSWVGEARRAGETGGSGCGRGPVFPATTKPRPGLAGPEYARAYLTDPITKDTPHLAISGIGAGNASRLAAIGVRGVAVSSEVCAAKAPDEACRAILSALGA